MKRVFLLLLCAVVWLLVACDPLCMGCGKTGYDPAPRPIEFRP